MPVGTNIWVGGYPSAETDICNAHNWSLDIVPVVAAAAINSGSTFYPETGTLTGSYLTLTINTGGRIGACTLNGTNNTFVINGGLIDGTSVSAGWAITRTSGDMKAIVFPEINAGRTLRDAAAVSIFGGGIVRG